MGDISIYFLVTFARFLTMVLIVVDVLRKNFDTGVVMNNITTSQMQPFKTKWEVIHPYSQYQSKKYAKSSTIPNEISTRKSPRIILYFIICQGIKVVMDPK